MKHFLLFLVLGFTVYFGWQVLDTRERKGAIQVTKKHAPKLLILFILALVSLVIAFYLPAIKLL